MPSPLLRLLAGSALAALLLAAFLSRRGRRPSAGAGTWQPLEA